ncbi:hypothetical protein [Klebsiella pneumoniae]|uniref:hypothetical protein n=1 Tax=Klebsiella pneumoniae TaxID=573 RepID=UPI003F5642CE
MKSYLYAKENLKKLLHGVITREGNNIDDFHLQRIKFTITSLNLPLCLKHDAENITIKIEVMIQNKKNYNADLQYLSVALLDLFTNIVRYIIYQSIKFIDIDLMYK